MENVGSKMEKDAAKWKNSTIPVSVNRDEALMNLGAVKAKIRELTLERRRLTSRLEPLLKELWSLQKVEEEYEKLLTPITVVTGRSHRTDPTLSEDEFVAALKEVRGGGKL